MNQLEDLTALSVQTCSGCGRKQDTKEFCRDCVRWTENYPAYPFKNEALFTYDDSMKEWLERFKIQGDVRLGDAFSSEVRAYLDPFIKKKFLVVPIPSDANKNRERGFNQVEQLLVYAHIKHEVLLCKKKNIQKQSTKNRKERMETLQLFEWSSDSKGKVIGRKVLLIDDVYTTGRTLFHAANLLKEAGAIEVRSFTVAR